MFLFYFYWILLAAFFFIFSSSAKDRQTDIISSSLYVHGLLFLTTSIIAETGETRLDGIELLYPVAHTTRSCSFLFSVLDLTSSSTVGGVWEEFKKKKKNLIESLEVRGQCASDQRCLAQRSIPWLSSSFFSPSLPSFHHYRGSGLQDITLIELGVRLFSFFSSS